MSESARRVDRLWSSGLEEGNWLVRLQMVAKAAPMLARGALIRLRLKDAPGLLLVGKGTIFRNPQFVSVGRRFVVEDYAEIQGLSTEGIVFGDDVTVGRFAMIRPSGYYGRQVGVGLRVGDNSNIGACCYVGCSGGITIGKGVLISPGVRMFAENHNFSRPDVPIKEQGVTRDRIVIEDDCWLASGSTVLAGVRIGTGAIVAAGAVVNKDVPARAVVGGVPARVIGSRDG